jgi:hypothetical protein
MNIISPNSASHILAVKSSDAVATLVPSGLYTALYILSVCPDNVNKAFVSATHNPSSYVGYKLTS